jgi:hypothetical protein
VDWPSVFFVALLSWLGVAVMVGTIVGHGISLGANRGSE